jgi:hypothetical protein
MKTTIEISNDLFQRITALARKQNTTFRALTEEGLRQVLQTNAKKKLDPIVTFGSGGVNPSFQDWNWDHIREEIYPLR